MPKLYSISSCFNLHRSDFLAEGKTPQSPSSLHEVEPACIVGAQNFTWAMCERKILEIILTNGF